MIAEGRVEVNGHVIRTMGVLVSDADEVKVDGDRVSVREQVYLILNKPKGVVTTTSDERGRQTVLDLIPEQYRHLKPVGRLDKDTEGLLILTNDGELAARLTHARYGIEKEYVAVLEGIPPTDAIERLRKGVFIDNERMKMYKVWIEKQDPKRMLATLGIILHEGRKRQIREMTNAIGFPIRSLRRIRVGHLLVKGMAPGECRLIPMKDVKRLRSSAGLDA
jgi:23S rRNA pseudouridine2605 synthase